MKFKEPHEYVRGMKGLVGLGAPPKKKGYQKKLIKHSCGFNFYAQAWRRRCPNCDAKIEE